ncbi:MAG TPA: hypothetical protein VLH35_00280 [Candidatus Acidoferrales bacterium]|nr:hypothetical protein [Candidatus Acidoferrales bacterium]
MRQAGSPYLGIELLAESLCSQLQPEADAANKTGVFVKSVGRRWYKRGLQQLLK